MITHIFQLSIKPTMIYGGAPKQARALSKQVTIDFRINNDDSIVITGNPSEDMVLYKNIRFGKVVSTVCMSTKTNMYVIYVMIEYVCSGAETVDTLVQQLCEDGWVV